MSLSTLRDSNLPRYLIPIGLLAATLLTYHFYNLSHPPASKRLKRSNARRVSRRTGRRTNSHPNSAASSSTADLDPGGVLTDDQLVEALSAEGGMDIPPSVTDALVDAAVAAQEARGAGGDRAARGGGGDDESDFSYAPEKENQNLLNLLYLIAEDQSKRDSYVHRGVTCNSCSVIPIRGIRYRCANCVDFDLCEHCEALDSHPKTHLFYKVRIPAPFLGNPRQAQTPWYPGKPGLMPPALPQDVIRKFTGEPACGFEPPEIEALYEQFKCLAATEYLSDPLGLNGAISRQTFDKCFVPNTHVRPPPPNLIYDRMFAFYDTDSNGLIGFEEFVRGLSALNNKHRNPEKLRRIFGGYDLDGDGYVDRRDFLRMFRAFYALSKDLVKDMVASMDDDMLEANQASNVLVGSQPISAAFAGSIPPGSRREGKGGADWGGDEDSDTDVAAVVLPSGTDRVSRAEIRADLDRRHSESAAFTLPEVRRGGGTTAHREPGEDDQTFEDWLAACEDFNSASSAAVAATMPALASADSTHSSASSFVSSPPPPTSTTSAPNTGPSVAEEADFNQHVEAAELASQRRLEFSTAESPGLSDEGNEGLGGMGMGDQDVGSEILYQITQQGLNELLDLLFAAKEEMALETRKGGEAAAAAAAAAAATATPESTEVPKGESTIEVEGAQGGEGGENKDGEGENKDGEGEGEGADGSDKEVEKKEMSKEEKEIAELERAREEIKVRGGEGRLNFKEFEQIMRGKHGRDLGFVSAWIDMASF